MIFFRKNIFYLLFIAVIVNSSCEKNDSLEERKITTKQNSKIIGKRGKTFTTKESFLKFINDYHINPVFKNSQLEVIDINEPLLRLVEFEPLVHALGDNGEITVEDVKYKITNVGTFFAHQDLDSSLSQNIIFNEDVPYYDPMLEEAPVAVGDEIAVPNFLNVKIPDLTSATLIDDEEQIYELRKGIYFKKDSDSEIFSSTIFDHTADSNSHSPAPTANTQSFDAYTNYTPSVFTGIDFANSPTRYFTKGNEEILENFGSKDRLVVQLKGKNFVFFSYLKASVRIDHKKKFWFGWRTLQNFDELRAGFINLVVDYNLPASAYYPVELAPNAVDNGLKPYLKQVTNIHIDRNTALKVYNLSQLANLPNLPFNIQNQLNHLLNNPQEIYNKVLDKIRLKAVDEVSNYIKKELDPYLSNNHFTYPHPKDNYLVIPIIEKSLTGKNAPDGAKINLYLAPQTALFKFDLNSYKFNNLKVGFTPAKTPKVISGAVFGAGKLNYIWKTGVIIKQQ